MLSESCELCTDTTITGITIAVIIVCFLIVVAPIMYKRYKHHGPNLVDLDSPSTVVATQPTEEAQSDQCETNNTTADQSHNGILPSDNNVTNTAVEVDHSKQIGTRNTPSFPTTFITDSYPTAAGRRQSTVSVGVQRVNSQLPPVENPVCISIFYIM